MKNIHKIGWFIVWMTIAASLIGCQKTTTTISSTETTWETNTNLLDGKLTGDFGQIIVDPFEIEGGSLYFTSELVEINFDVLLNRLVVTIAIDDSMYADYTYVAIMRPLTIAGPEVSTVFLREESHTVHVFTFECFDNAGTYRFLLGKKINSQMVPSLIENDASLGFDLRIPTFDLRKKVGVAGWTFPSYRVEKIENHETVLGKNRTSLKIAFVDSNHAVQTVKLVITEVDTLFDVMTIPYPIGEYRDEEGKVHLSNIFITDLAPDVEYRFVLLATGHDGFESFTDRPIGTYDFTTDAFEGIVDSTHGMYAYIQNGGTKASGYSFQVHLTFDEEYALATTQATQSFVVRVRDENGTLLHEEPIETGEQIPVDLENAILGFDHAITVENLSGDIVLCRHFISFPESDIRFNRSKTADGDIFTFYWYVRAWITGGFVEIIYNNTIYRLYTIQEGSTLREVVIEVPEDLVDEDLLRVHIQINYSVFGGLVTESINLIFWAD